MKIIVNIMNFAKYDLIFMFSTFIHNQLCMVKNLPFMEATKNAGMILDLFDATKKCRHDTRSKNKSLMIFIDRKHHVVVVGERETDIWP